MTRTRAKCLWSIVLLTRSFRPVAVMSRAFALLGNGIYVSLVDDTSPTPMDLTDAVKLVMEVCGCQELWFHTSIEDSIKQPVCNGRYICYVAHISMNNAHFENVYMDVSKNNGTPKSSHFNMVFHYKPLHVGGNTPIFGETSIYCKCRIPDATRAPSLPSEAWGAQLSLSCNMGTLSPGSPGEWKV